MKKLYLKTSHLMSVTDGGSQYSSSLPTEKNVFLQCAFATVTLTKHKCPEIKLFIARAHISII